ncbi:hypothetical protein T484DRAFT_1757824 [Baffinella frigidus]|nr:hypothetical protein T484DRAFT_1757824 [Cryptophyta sp. CCMP2293]
MDLITSNTTLWLSHQADKLKIAVYEKTPDLKTALAVRLQQAYEFGAPNGVQVLKGEGDGLDPESLRFVPRVPERTPEAYDTDTVIEDVGRYSIFCTRKRGNTTTDDTKTDVIGDGHFFNSRRFAWESGQMDREIALIKMNPNTAAAAAAKEVAYDIHRRLMKASVSNKLLHLLLYHVKYSYESLKCGTVLRDTLVAKAFIDMHCFLFKLQDKEFSLDVDIPEEVRGLNVFKSYNLVIRHGRLFGCESTGLNFAHHLVHMCSYEHMRCVIGRLGMGVIPKANPVMLKHAHETSNTRDKGWCKTNSAGGQVYFPDSYHNHMMKNPDTHKYIEWPKMFTGGDGTDLQPVATVPPTIKSPDRPANNLGSDRANWHPNGGDPSENGSGGFKSRDGRQVGKVPGGAAWSGNGDDTDTDVLF